MENALPLQQSPDFGAALTAIGRPPRRWNGQILMRRRLCGLPLTLASRIVLDGPDALADLPRAPLILSPDHPAPWLFSSGAWPLMTPASVAEIDLTQTEDQLLANQNQKWRNRLRHGLKHDLIVTQSPIKNDITHWLYQAEMKSQNRNSYRNYPIALIHAFAALGPNRSRLFICRKQGRVLAAMLFLRHGPAASYLIGHTTDMGRRVSAHTVLLWQAMLWLRKQGHTRLDLGPIDTLHSPGLARFKLGSGARARPLGGTWLMMPGLTAPARLIAHWDKPLFASAHGRKLAGKTAASH